jgi:hypothetical protein
MKSSGKTPCQGRQGRRNLFILPKFVSEQPLMAEDLRRKQELAVYYERQKSCMLSKDPTENRDENRL